MRFFSKKGQSTLEYAFLIVGIVAAIVAIQLYVKRGMEGRLRAASDDIGDQFRISTVDANSSQEHSYRHGSSFTSRITSGDLIQTVTEWDNNTRWSSALVNPWD